MIFAKDKAYKQGIFLSFKFLYLNQHCACSTDVATAGAPVVDVVGAAGAPVDDLVTAGACSMF